MADNMNISQEGQQRGHNYRSPHTNGLTLDSLFQKLQIFQPPIRHYEHVPSQGRGGRNHNSNQRSRNNHVANAVFNQNRDYGPTNHQFYARMTQTMLFSRIATIETNKIDHAYIDSGATHNFFRSKSAFQTYKKINPEPLKAAHGETMMIGKETVFIPIGKGFNVHAYRVPAFSANIIAAHVLFEDFDVLLSSFVHGKKGVIFSRRAL